MRKSIIALSLLSTVLFNSCDTLSPTSIENAKDAATIKSEIVATCGEKEVVAIDVAATEALSSSFNGGKIYYMAGDKMFTSYFRKDVNDGKMDAPSEYIFAKEMTVGDKKIPAFNKAQKVSAFPYENMAAGINTAKETLKKFATENDEKLGEPTCSQITMISTEAGIISRYRIETREGTQRQGRRMNTNYYQFEVIIAPDGTTQVDAL